MKLSEAILLGAMMSPQAFRALFRDEGACALGAALLAVGPISEPAIRSVLKRWPWAMTVSTDCPGCGHSCPVFGVITHLNDTHRWTREQIAEWVASIEPAEVLAEVPNPIGGRQALGLKIPPSLLARALIR
jgi:hypothetical protein